MQRRFPRINEKGECEKNMDGLSYFKHVAIVALDFSTNPEAKKRADIRGVKEGIGIASKRFSGRCQPVHRLHICCRSEK